MESFLDRGAPNEGVCLMYLTNHRKASRARVREAVQKWSEEKPGLPFACQSWIRSKVTFLALVLAPHSQPLPCSVFFKKLFIYLFIFREEKERERKITAVLKRLGLGILYFTFQKLGTPDVFVYVDYVSQHLPTQTETT